MMGMENGMGEAASRGPVASVGTGECVLSLVHPPRRDHSSCWRLGQALVMR